jgi:hypothetical protein
MEEKKISKITVADLASALYEVWGASMGGLEQSNWHLLNMEKITINDLTILAYTINKVKNKCQE